MITPLDILHQSPLFESMSDAVGQKLLLEMEEVQLAEGEVLFREGEPGDAVYIVAEGLINLELAGTRIVTRDIGACIGEFALIDDGPRSATAVAASKARLLKLGRDAFNEILGSHPQVAKGVLETLTGKLRDEGAARIKVEVQRAKLEHEMELAHRIQVSMLPAGNYVFGNFEISCLCKPAEKVGGDYVDYIPLDDGRVAIILGDVTGHGVDAGLFVAMAKSCLHTQLRNDPSPAAVMRSLNRAISLPPGVPALMSCCYMVLDAASAKLSYINAGHPHPLLYNKGMGDIISLDTTDPPLGVFRDEDPDYSAVDAPWQPGSMLLIYSDGISELKNSKGAMFGDARVIESFRNDVGRTAADVEIRLETEIDRHAGLVPPRDDMTLIVVRARAV
ncbi:MAG: SpoIIE family protein phosphatase [Gammaproteobacteria bacterium]|nr:SpoIIE family protein phosphatase [Gammaproteobacteria bacterium]NNM00280.1 SpoIIE family protein phosphatase [Gammaproteobacteria bacterium]